MSFPQPIDNNPTSLSNKITSGEVFFLSGPSSTGKSTFSKSKQGAFHLEGDQFLAVTDLNFVAKHRGAALDVIKQTFQKESPQPEEILPVIMGKTPELTPKNQREFDDAQASIKSLLDDRWTTIDEKGVRKGDPVKAQAIWQEVFITMLNKAVELSTIGKTVIIDTVALMGESPEVSAHDLKPLNSSLWAYKRMKIKQLLKYATVDRVSQNILSRNVSGDTRDPMVVLGQYADRFKKADVNDEVVGQLEVSQLENWIERFTYMEHLKISPSINVEEIDGAIKVKRKELPLSDEITIRARVKNRVDNIKGKMALTDVYGTVSITYRTVSTDGITPQPQIII